MAKKPIKKKSQPKVAPAEKKSKVDPKTTIDNTSGALIDCLTGDKKVTKLLPPTLFKIDVEDDSGEIQDPLTRLLQPFGNRDLSSTKITNTSSITDVDAKFSSIAFKLSSRIDMIDGGLTNLNKKFDGAISQLNKKYEAEHKSSVQNYRKLEAQLSDIKQSNYGRGGLQTKGGQKITGGGTRLPFSGADLAAMAILVFPHLKKNYLDPFFAKYDKEIGNLTNSIADNRAAVEATRKAARITSGAVTASRTVAKGVGAAVQAVTPKTPAPKTPTPKTPTPKTYGTPGTTTSFTGAPQSTPASTAKPKLKKVPLGAIINNKLTRSAFGMLLKKLPVIGLGAAMIDAGVRIGRGDGQGAALAAGSGLAGMLPGVGTFGSFVADLTLIARDIFKEVHGRHPDLTDPEDIKEMGRIYEHIGKTRKSNEAYIKAEINKANNQALRQSDEKTFRAAMAKTGQMRRGQYTGMEMDEQVASTTKGGYLFGMIGGKRVPGKTITLDQTKISTPRQTKKSPAYDINMSRMNLGAKGVPGTAAGSSNYMAQSAGAAGMINPPLPMQRQMAMMPPLPTMKPQPLSFASNSFRERVYQQKSQFMQFGALPAGFENVMGNRGILGKPVMVAASGAQPFGGGFGGGGFGGGGRSGYSGGYSSGGGGPAYSGVPGGSGLASPGTAPGVSSPDGVNFSTAKGGAMSSPSGQKYTIGSTLDVNSFYGGQKVSMGGRSFNPGNIKYSGSDWQKQALSKYMAGVSSEKDEGTNQIMFKNPVAGAAASTRLTMAYVTGKKVKNIQDYVSIYTPGNVAGHSAHIAELMGVSPTANLNWRDPKVLYQFERAKQIAEVGKATYEAMGGDRMAKRGVMHAFKNDGVSSGFVKDMPKSVTAFFETQSAGAKQPENAKAIVGTRESGDSGVKVFKRNTPTKNMPGSGADITKKALDLSKISGFVAHDSSGHKSGRDPEFQAFRRARSKGLNDQDAYYEAYRGIRDNRTRRSYHQQFKHGTVFYNELTTQRGHAADLNSSMLGMAHLGFEGVKLDKQTVATGAAGMMRMYHEVKKAKPDMTFDAFLGMWKTHPELGKAGTRFAAGKAHNEGSWVAQVKQYFKTPEGQALQQLPYDRLMNITQKQLFSGKYDRGAISKEVAPGYDDMAGLGSMMQQPRSMMQQPLPGLRENLAIYQRMQKMQGAPRTVDQLLNRNVGSGGTSKSEGGLQFPIGGKHGLWHRGHGRSANYGYERNRLHAGVDIYAMDKEGKLQIGKDAPIFASEDMKIVSFVKNRTGMSSGTGNMVIAKGLRTGTVYRYLHMTNQLQKNPGTNRRYGVGDVVKAGKSFGNVGGTGTYFGAATYERMRRAASSGRPISYEQAMRDQVDYFNKNGWSWRGEQVAKPHLHFETRKSTGKGGSFDPSRMFPEYSRKRGVLNREVFGKPGVALPNTPGVALPNTPGVNKLRAIAENPLAAEIPKQVPEELQAAYQMRAHRQAKQEIEGPKANEAELDAGVTPNVKEQLTDMGDVEAGVEVESKKRTAAQAQNAKDRDSKNSSRTRSAGGRGGSGQHHPEQEAPRAGSSGYGASGRCWV